MTAFLQPGAIAATAGMAFESLAYLVTLATVITAATPTRWESEVLDRLFHWLNLIAGNVGHNRNADDQ
ncbi:MAG: hypothetical protein K9G33_08420 [Sneathiella sp.]|nr:hypothetical protein [Sneathiella sp.]